MKTDFVHLCVHSTYSILEGLGTIPNLVQRAKELGMSALALTDQGNLYGAKAFHEACIAEGIKPILGCELRANDEHALCLYAKNKLGYQNLMRLVSAAHLAHNRANPCIDRNMLRLYREGLACVSECLSEECASAYQELFGADYYLEVSLSPVMHRSPDISKDSESALQAVFQRQLRNLEMTLALGKKLGISCLATNNVRFVRKEDIDACDVMLALGARTTLIDPHRPVYSGSEWLKSADEMEELFSECPELLSNTLMFADRIGNYALDDVPHMPVFDVPTSHGGADDYLRELAYQGAKERWVEPLSKEVSDRLDYELGVIARMGFSGYMLIVWDYVTAARRMDVAVGPGRGSAAGSAVAYALGITAVDPIKFGLLFERFLNPDRIALPDIDVDFDSKGRQKVIDYVVNKYGVEHVARIISFTTFTPGSAIKDVGRVLDYPRDESIRLAALDAEERPRVLEQGTPIERRILSLAAKLEGGVRQIGMHPCGIIISPDALTDYAPLAKASKGSLPVTQFSDRYVECTGLVKFDFLGLEELYDQKKLLKAIRDEKGEALDLDSLPYDDAETLKLFKQGDTEHIFQFGSAGMQHWLRALRPNSFEQLVAMNALYRPGPQNQIPRFVARSHGMEDVVYRHPLMEEYTRETYGLVIYQEQILLLARRLAGFTRAQADRLRKAIAKKKQSTLDQMHPLFIKGCLGNADFRVGEFADENRATSCAESIWRAWCRFAWYAFCKAHAVAYTRLAYQSAYLKVHYPGAFQKLFSSTEGEDSDCEVPRLEMKNLTWQELREISQRKDFEVLILVRHAERPPLDERDPSFGMDLPLTQRGLDNAEDFGRQLYDAVGEQEPQIIVGEAVRTIETGRCILRGYRLRAGREQGALDMQHCVELGGSSPFFGNMGKAQAADCLESDLESLRQSNILVCVTHDVNVASFAETRGAAGPFTARRRPGFLDAIVAYGPAHARHKREYRYLPYELPSGGINL